jgi:processive 1,2-diacylglycerol beta-glucosyltransferase
VAFCAASVGCGHARAAAAVHAALVEEDAGLDAAFIEALEGAPRWFERLYRDGYLAAIRHAPRAVGALYDWTDSPLREERALAALLDRGEDALLGGFRAREELRTADVVVSTHFLATAVLGRMRLRGALGAPLVTIVTDEHPHAVWLHRGSDMTCVASDEARAAAIGAGLDPARVACTGIPIDPAFARQRARAAKAPAPGAPPTVLVTGGGHGLGEIATAVETLASECPRARIVAVCGRNAALEARLRALAAAQPAGEHGGPVHVVGYTNRMPALLARAALLVGKPGGLTSTEARAVGVPMLLLRPIPGQEERNARRLVDAGAALRLPSAAHAGRLARDLLGDAPRLATMRAAALASGRPLAAHDAARVIATMAARARRGAVRAAV